MPISAALSADGCELTKYEREGSRIEVDVVRDRTRYEFHVDATSGDVTGLETSARRGPSPLRGGGDDQIRAFLQSRGYEVTGYERMGGEIEVYAMKGGRRWDLDIDPRTGGTPRVEAED